MQKIIGIVGPSHSGTTLLYNLVYIIYKKAGYSVDACNISDFYLKNYRYDTQILIVKCHDYNYELDKIHDLLLLTIRDFRESSMIWKKIYNPNATDVEIIENINNNISRFKCWEHKSFIFRYEDYMLNPLNYLNQLLFILGIKLDTIIKNEVLKEIYSLYNTSNNNEMNLILKQKISKIKYINDVLKQFGYC